MRKVVFLGLLVLLGVSCSSTKNKLTVEGRSVQVIDGKLNRGCEVIGKVVGENEQDSEQMAINHARNQTADMGGNYLKVTDTVRNGKSWRIHAHAVSCQ